MAEKELVTVLMSVYKVNIEELKLSIESILNQTYNNFEFIIINDGADKEIIDVIKSYDDDRVKIYDNDKNIGLAESLNKGIELAKSNYIVRMDADDIAYLNRIELQYEFIKTHPEYAIVGGKAKIFDNEGIYGETKIRGEIPKELLVKGTPFAHPTLIINKEALKSTGGYPNYRRGQDYAMVMNMYANNFKGYIIDDFILKYRVDKFGFKRRKFKNRLQEVQMRYKFFRKMKIPYLKRIYIFKPIIAGIIPSSIMRRYQRNKFKENN